MASAVSWDWGAFFFDVGPTTSFDDVSTSFCRLSSPSAHAELLMGLHLSLIELNPTVQLSDNLVHRLASLWLLFDVPGQQQPAAKSPLLQANPHARLFWQLLRSSSLFAPADLLTVSSLPSTVWTAQYNFVVQLLAASPAALRGLRGRTIVSLLDEPGFLTVRRDDVAAVVDAQLLAELEAAAVTRAHDHGVCLPQIATWVPFPVPCLLPGDDSRYWERVATACLSRCDDAAVDKSKSSGDQVSPRSSGSEATTAKQTATATTATATTTTTTTTTSRQNSASKRRQKQKQKQKLKRQQMLQKQQQEHQQSDNDGSGNHNEDDDDADVHNNTSKNENSADSWPSSGQFFERELAAQLWSTPFSPAFVQLAPPVLDVGGTELQWTDVAQQRHLPAIDRLLIDDAAALPSSAVGPLRALLSRAQNECLPPLELRTLVTALSESPAAVLAAGFAPSALAGAVDKNPSLAFLCLVQLSSDRQFDDYLPAVQSLPLGPRSLELVSRLCKTVGLPASTVKVCLSKWFAACSSLPAGTWQSRIAALLCLFVQWLQQQMPLTVEELLPEILAFSLEFSKVREAATLYQQLK